MPRCILTTLVLTVAATAFGQPLKPDRHFQVTMGPNGHRVDEIQPTLTSTPPTPGSHRPAPVFEKIHPHLRELLEQSRTETVEVLIGFDDGISIPRFPKQLGNEARNSPVNAASDARAQALIKEITARRNAKNATRQQRYRALGIERLETFWLTGAWRARLPLTSITALAAEPDVISIEATGIGIEPPAYRGRAMINSDWFVNHASLFYDYPYVIVAILDTGVRITHTMFNNPDVIRNYRDCVNGTTNNCITGTNLNPADDHGHGTATAGLISGNGGTLGTDYKGVATFTIDSYRIYNASHQAVEAAALRGFQAAVAEGAWVIVAEIQWPGTFTGSIAAAAEAAFDAGSTVVAANGNSPNNTVVASPANAHRVLGIGAVDSETGVTLSTQLSGPTTDNRIKPDVQLPSRPVSTAGRANDTAYWNSYSGTSAATAWAGGVAALLHRAYCDSSNKCIDPSSNTPNPYPGPNYAAMIQFGTLSYPFQSTRGAGTIRLWGCYGWDTFGWVTIQNGQTVDVSIWLGNMSGYSAPADWQVAIWWPETASQTHSQVNMYLRNPSNTTTLASSTDANSVFQRAQVTGTLANGTYYLRLTGANVSGSQQVFYSSRARQANNCP